MGPLFTGEFKQFCHRTLNTSSLSVQVWYDISPVCKNQIYSEFTRKKFVHILYLFELCLLQYVQSLTPDDGRKDSPKYVQCYSNKINLRLMHLVGFTIEIYHDARTLNVKYVVDNWWQICVLDILCGFSWYKKIWLAAIMYGVESFKLNT